MALSLAALARRTSAATLDAAILRFLSSSASRFSVASPPRVSKPLPNLDAIAAALRSSKHEEVLRHIGGRLTIFLFLKVIRSLRDADAWVIFVDWAGAQQGFLHTPLTCNALLDLLERARRSEQIVGAFGRIFSQEWKPNALSYCYLVKALCRTGKIDKACTTIAEMAGEKLVPDVFTYNVVIDTLCKARRISRAIDFFETMLAPDVVTYNTLLGGLCKNGRVTQACSLFGSMEGAGITPSDVTYTTLIDVFCKMCHFETAYGLLQLMTSRKCSPTVYSYCSIINGLCKNRKVDQAYQLFEEMKLAGCKPDRVTYNTLIHGLCVKQRLHEAKDLLTVMVENGIQPDKITFTALIEGLCTAGQLKEAFVLFQGIAKQGCAPDLVSHTVLVSKLCIRRKLRLSVLRNYPACPEAVILYTPIFQGTREEEIVRPRREAAQEDGRQGRPPKRGDLHGVLQGAG